MAKTIVNASMEVGNIDVTIDGYVHYHVETDYGADADGNRGEKRTIIDDVTDINAYDADINSVALSKEDLEKAAHELTREFFNE